MHDGVINALWRYPVKSLLGEKLDRLEFDARGAVNDRRFALLTNDGRLGSGKNTSKLCRIDALLSVSAKSQGSGVAITFADGEVLTEQSTDVDAKLSNTFGQRLKLTREQDTAHFDDSPVHIITSSALSKLNTLLPDAGIDERRFRANIVLQTAPAVAEGELVGKIIRIGEVELRVTHQTERCRMTTLEQLGLSAIHLESRPEILRTISKNFDLNFGVYASVLKTGIVHCGQAISIINR